MPNRADDAPGAGEGARRRYLSTIVEVEGREETRIVEMPAFEPDPWGPEHELDVVGKPLPRVDAREKVTGRAVYTADVSLPGMLYAVMVRATIPRGRASVDLAPARDVPGVIDVLGSADLTARLMVRGVALFDPAVHYAGQPLAAVCAESLEAARRGAAAVVVTYEPAPFAVTYDAATVATAPALRPGARADAAAPDGRTPNLTRSSPHITSRGSIERGLDEADVVIRATYRTGAALHSALEPHGAVAEWSGGGGGARVTIWESTQGIFSVREKVADALGLPLSSVRVISEYMGGGFGAKNGAGAHTFIAALLARRTGRAVRCVNDRAGEQTDTGFRAAATIHVTLGARADGTLTAIGANAEIPLGIAGWEAPPTAIFHEMYSCPNVRTEERFAYVNTQAMAAFRGPGHAEGAFALERALDELARALGMDRLELRRRNVAQHDEAKGRPYSANRLLECYARGAELIGWTARASDGGRDEAVTEIARADATMSSGGPPGGVGRRLQRGIGVAAQIWGTGGGPPAHAIVRLNGDGSADIFTGTQDLGTGTRTILAQIAADALGARFADVRVVLGDTEHTPYAGNSWGSMTTASVGPAVRMAAEDAKRQLLEAAAEMLEASPADLVARDGEVRSVDGGRALSIMDVCKRLEDVMIIGRGTRGPNQLGMGFVTIGAQFAEVEVDTETGIVRVLRIVAVHDAGRIINPLLAGSQVEGGILQGLGYALCEERILDAALGLPLNPGLHDYKLATMADAPRIDVVLLEGSDVLANHVGARGLAEAPIIPTAPAIANAVADALGVEVREIPLTPWRILGAMQDPTA